MSNLADDRQSTAREPQPIDTEALERLEAALLTLPRFRREVFLARRLDNMSYAEIAKITGASERCIKREFEQALRGFLRAMTGERTRKWWQPW